MNIVADGAAAGTTERRADQLLWELILPTESNRKGKSCIGGRGETLQIIRR
jgi:hypothetical protein